jgi:hypothetical protein
VAGISEQRHRIDPQTGRGLDANISKIEHHPDGKGPAEIWRRMAVPMAMMIMTAQRMAVSVAVHGGFMGPAARHRNEKGGPSGPPFQATTGAGEEIRTLDFNLGKSQFDVLYQYINGLYRRFKSEHDPKMAICFAQPIEIMDI